MKSGMITRMIVEASSRQPSTRKMALTTSRKAIGESCQASTMTCTFAGMFSLATM